jgi:two-component system OmpR family response regulator
MVELQKILYVEDEPDIRAVAQLALEMVGGFTLKICESGLQALQEGEAFAPDLVLMDVMMPEMTGPMTLERFKTMPGMASVPVIFMTAKVQPAEISQFKAMGAIDVIPKPFDPMQLANQVRKIWSACGG